MRTAEWTGAGRWREVRLPFVNYSSDIPMLHSAVTHTDHRTIPGTECFRSPVSQFDPLDLSGHLMQMRVWASEEFWGRAAKRGSDCGRDGNSRSILPGKPNQNISDVVTPGQNALGTFPKSNRCICKCQVGHWIREGSTPNVSIDLARWSGLLVQIRVPTSGADVRT